MSDNKQDNNHEIEQSNELEQDNTPLDDKAEQDGSDKIKSEIDLRFKDALHRPIATVEVEYLKNQMPFLQLINIEFEESNMHEPRLITARSGWVIHDYEEAITSSPGEMLWSTTKKELDKAEKGDADGGDEGGGTVINQAYETVVQMIEIAKELGWKGISIVDGHRLMEWAAWHLGNEANLAVHGFEPTAEEEKKSKRIKRSEAETDYIRHTRSKGNR